MSQKASCYMCDSIAITSFDLKAKYLYVSPSVKTLLGYDPNDLMGKSFFDFIHPNDKKVLLPLVKKYIKLIVTKALRINDPGISETIEYRFKDSVGNWHYLQSTLNFIGKDLLAITRDITERKKAEMELQQSEVRFKQLFESLGDAVYVTQIGGKDKGKILEVNPAAVKQTGYSRSELLGMNIVSDFYVSGSGSINTDQWEEKLLSGETVTTTEKKRKKDGSEFWTEVIVTPIDYKGKKAGLSINHDITERKLAEEALIKSEEKFRYVLENSVVVIYSLNLLTGTYDYLSPSVKTIFGYTPEEFIVGGLETSISRFHPDDVIEIDNHLQKLLSHKLEDFTPTVEYRFNHPVLGYRWMSDTRTVIFDDYGNPVYYYYG